MKDKIEIRTKVYELMYEALRDAGIMLLVIAMLMIIMVVAGCPATM